MIVLLTTEKGFDWRRTHQGVLLDIYCQHCEFSQTGTIATIDDITGEATPVKQPSSNNGPRRSRLVK